MWPASCMPRCDQREQKLESRPTSEHKDHPIVTRSCSAQHSLNQQRRTGSQRRLPDSTCAAHVTSLWAYLHRRRLRLTRRPFGPTMYHSPLLCVLARRSESDARPFIAQPLKARDRLVQMPYGNANVMRQGPLGEQRVIRWLVTINDVRNQCPLASWMREPHLRPRIEARPIDGFTLLPRCECPVIQYKRTRDLSNGRQLISASAIDRCKRDHRMTTNKETSCFVRRRQRSAVVWDHFGQSLWADGANGGFSPNRFRNSFSNACCADHALRMISNADSSIASPRSS